MRYAPCAAVLAFIPRLIASADRRLTLPAMLLAFLAPSAAADVFRMPAGQTSLEFVTVGDPGNAGELSGAGAGGWGEDRVCGAVSYTYEMGKFEVTAAQYTEFLNAVAKSDPYGLYNTQMADPSKWAKGCNIQRTGSSGDYEYSVSTEYANRPVNFTSWADAARFANWLTNGQPRGAQGPGITEDGSYVLNGVTYDAALLRTQRTANARYVIPSEDEWYKAAYFDPWKTGEPGYCLYPTHEDVAPNNLSFLNENNANYSGPNSHPDGFGGYWTTEVGAFKKTANYYGTYDQAGNVYEWTEGLAFSQYRLIKGGSFESNELALRSNYREFWGGGELGRFGFRIALVPEPASIGFLSLGLLLFLRRRSAN